MILQGHEDLRIVKTIEAIKRSFEELVCEKNFEKITVKELCDRARINKKTFYHYYETLDALLAEMQYELSKGFLERIQEYHLPEELDKVNREFFLFSAEQGQFYEKITIHSAYHSIRDDMISEVNEKGWAHSEWYQNLSDFEKRLLMDFIDHTTLSAYREWIVSGKTIPLEQVIETNNRLQTVGVDGFFRKK